MSDEEAAILGISPREFPLLSQKELERELNARFPEYIDNVTLLGIYTKWLVKQVPYLGLFSHRDSSKTIRNCCNYLSSKKYDKGMVISAFSRHKSLYLKDRPKGIRTFNLARRDIEINYKISPDQPPKPASSHATESSDTQPALAHQSKPPLISAQQTLATPFTQPSGGFCPESDEPKLSHRQELLARLEKLKTKNPLVNTIIMPSSSEKQVPPANYICNRCGIPGHFIKQCQTNGDPSYDRPPNNYFCRLCGAVGSHYSQNCPKNSENTTSKVAEPIRSRPHCKSKSSAGSKKNSPGASSLFHIGAENMKSQNAAVRTTETSIEQASIAKKDCRNEGPAQHIQSHTDSHRPGPQELTLAGGGPLRSGSNTDPIGRRRRVDSYRPNDSYRPSLTCTNDQSGKIEQPCKKEAKFYSQTTKERLDGRLSPWEDMQLPAKKRHREDYLADEGLPWDDIHKPLKRQRDYPSDSPSERICLSRKSNSIESPDLEHLRTSQKDNMEMNKVLDEELEVAGIMADAFLAKLERELAQESDFQGVGASIHTGIIEDSENPVTSLKSSTTQRRSLVAPAPSNDGGVCMAETPKDVYASVSNLGSIDSASRGPVIVSFQTLKPLQRDPPYDRCVLDLFRGREHENVYVNVLRRRTAIDMYEETDEERTATELSNLTV